jgi:hypothetical protein
MKTTFAIAFLILFISCSESSSDKSTEPTSADRSKFVGTWAGSYSCLGGDASPDTMVIIFGNGSLDLSIIIHVEAFNPDTVSGVLTEPNIINVSEQSMGGAPGTALLTIQGSVLTYSQTGFGITCGGTDYTKVP